MVATKVCKVLVWTERSVGLSATYSGENLEVCGKFNVYRSRKGFQGLKRKMSEKGEKRASWPFIEKQIFLAGSFMNEQFAVFSVKRGSGFAWPLHRFCGEGGF